MNGNAKATPPRLRILRATPAATQLQYTPACDPGRFDDAVVGVGKLAVPDGSSVGLPQRVNDGLTASRAKDPLVKPTLPTPWIASQ